MEKSAKIRNDEYWVFWLIPYKKISVVQQKQKPPNSGKLQITTFLWQRRRLLFGGTTVVGLGEKKRFRIKIQWLFPFWSAFSVV